MRFDSKVAIVTGAGSGIGRAIALALAREGSKVVIAERIEEMGNSVANEINNAGGQAISIKVDVSKSSEVSQVVKNTLDQFGKIDILVNNAGVALIENFIEGEERRWNTIMAVNVNGVLVCTRAVLDSMIKQNYGKIINMGSNAGEMGLATNVVYSASKGAVIAFTKALAKEIASHKINVNCICPGMIETPMVTTGIEVDPSHFKLAIERIPWGRLGRPEDIASLTAFLASDESEYITGAIIDINGGQSGL